MPPITPLRHVIAFRAHVDAVQRVRTCALRRAIQAVAPYRGQGMGPPQVWAARRHLLHIRQVLEAQNSAVLARKTGMLDALEHRLQWNAALAAMR
ncbi:hypothetical protein SAMN05216551_10142 [Chitinasiproducens palmae]|uniref:Uncharacterized protein n=1 Tax=Chitinasiproducens palmae TaxID=1770053 RepID=A0A1H2PIE8_9BURK|nr:hypothetical protein SAMN05216551_10142 [Chitinasiproducens palmae]